MRIRPGQIIAILVCLIVGGGLWYAAALRRGVMTAYYEWGTTELICAFSQDNNWDLPQSWIDLIDYEECSEHYNGNLWTIEDAKTHIHVDFHELLRRKNGEIRSLPTNTIKCLRGLEVHWIDSSSTLERLVSKHEIPDGLILKGSTYSEQRRRNEIHHKSLQ